MSRISSYGGRRGYSSFSFPRAASPAESRGRSSASLACAASSRCTPRSVPGAAHRRHGLSSAAGNAPDGGSPSPPPVRASSTQTSHERSSAAGRSAEPARSRPWPPGSSPGDCPGRRPTSSRISRRTATAACGGGISPPRASPASSRSSGGSRSGRFSFAAAESRARPDSTATSAAGTCGAHSGRADGCRGRCSSSTTSTRRARPSRLQPRRFEPQAPRASMW